MTEAKRQKIKDEVAAGEARHRAREDSTLFDRAGEAAIEAKDRFTSFAKEHPLTTVAGGVALGILISGLFPRSPTRKLGKKAASKAAGLAAIGAEVAMAYMHQARDAASHAGRTGGHRLDGWGDTIGDTARRLKQEAAHLAEAAGESARVAGRDASERLSRHLHRRS